MSDAAATMAAEVKGLHDHLSVWWQPLLGVRKKDDGPTKVEVATKEEDTSTMVQPENLGDSCKMLDAGKKETSHVAAADVEMSSALVAAAPGSVLVNVEWDCDLAAPLEWKLS